MTLVGIVLVYPCNDLIGAARSTIDLSVAVLEDFGNSIAVASGAVKILGKLCPKVDILMEKIQGKKGVRLKVQLVTDYQEVDEQRAMDGNFPAFPSMDESLEFFNVTSPEF